MYPRQAAEALDDLALLRQRSRRSIGPPWVALVTFGAAFVGFAVVIAVHVRGLAVGYWIAVAVLGGVVVRRAARRRTDRVGIAGPARHWQINLMMFAACFVVVFLGGLLGGQRGAVGAACMAVLIGYAVLGVLAHGWRTPALVLPVAVVALVLDVTGARPWIVLAVFGVGLVAAGATVRALDGARP